MKDSKELQALNRIQELCEERGWSYYRLAKASGITYSTLNTMIHKQNLPSLTTLQKICDGFGISLTDFFDPNRDVSGLTDEQAKCLSLFTSLTPQKQELALAYMKGLSEK
ncbi:MAG: helix-turn-helix transcriptional regulator [Lachnospiraceae bacterium]|nr:helix-turn-helix transcriptional regulator [Lachnospiraceae bacterium]MCD7764012.1 helix-turn-helix transcriptional regulator [Lachnospiraceae bacterium]MCD7765205.1 helix-turn-helix transcriptional regulator [Lachnospiraceae bacterium]